MKRFFEAVGDTVTIALAILMGMAMTVGGLIFAVFVISWPVWGVIAILITVKKLFF